ncbi:hypothetical protein [Trinickia soli]|uniref:Uncharacterized protein n=1 Tax=Trinickia soli TaxID=380675 RepID=A0A2N7WCK0_9BURK|nr:hypothetical protein [Trinickia soli]PMS27138.1 hypothetical protein C0Z19_05135 [Trinickia soli]CAB3637700.1 hypothetical protein LMG24076_00002 [Trinickia soli]
MTCFEKKHISWFIAFKILLIGKAPAIGRYPQWKSTVLVCAIAVPIGLGPVSWKQIATVSGGVPPQVPLIRATGTFVQVTRGQASYVSLVTDDGHAYNMERGTTLRHDIDMLQGDPAPRVYVEGFLREDGRGYFWPTLIKAPDGRLLLTPERSMLKLRSMIKSMRRLSIFFAVLTAAIWIISIYFLFEVKRNLSVEV